MIYIYIICNYIISIHLKYALLIYVCDYYITYSSTKNSMFLENFSLKETQTPYHCFFQVTEIPCFSLHQSPLVQW